MARNRTIVTESGSRYVLYESDAFDSVTRFSEAPIFDCNTGLPSSELVIDTECIWHSEPTIGHPWAFRVAAGPVRTTRVVEINEDFLTHVLD